MPTAQDKGAADRARRQALGDDFEHYDRPALRLRAVALSYLRSAVKPSATLRDGYLGVPLVETPNEDYVRFAVFVIRHGRLTPVATLPNDRADFEFGWGFNWRSPATLELMHPDERVPAESACCMDTRRYTYTFSGGKPTYAKQSRDESRH